MHSKITPLMCSCFKRKVTINFHACGVVLIIRASMYVSKHVFASQQYVTTGVSNDGGGVL